MLIDPHKLQHWVDHFYGYGLWTAENWFISYEEGGGDVPDDVADKINFFYSQHPQHEPSLCDIREFSKKVIARLSGSKANLFTTRYDYRFGSQAVQNTIWKNIIAFEHGISRSVLPDTLDFQRADFLSPHRGKEALITLYPLPSPHNHAWYYSWLDLPALPYLRSREMYESAMYQSRISTILTNMASYKPKLVLMYGMSNVNMLKASISKAFGPVTFNLVKAVKQHTPQHHRATIGDSLLIITTQVPALRHNRIETGFDWYAFGSSL